MRCILSTWDFAVIPQRVMQCSFPLCQSQLLTNLFSSFRLSNSPVLHILSCIATSLIPNAVFFPEVSCGALIHSLCTCYRQYCLHLDVQSSQPHLDERHAGFLFPFHRLSLFPNFYLHSLYWPVLLFMVIYQCNCVMVTLYFC